MDGLNEKKTRLRTPMKVLSTRASKLGCRGEPRLMETFKDKDRLHFTQATSPSC